MIKTTCNHCGGENQVPEQYADKTIKCSSCFSQFKVRPLDAVASASTSTFSIGKMALFCGLCGAMIVFLVLQNGSPSVESKKPIKKADQISVLAEDLMTVGGYADNFAVENMKLKLGVSANEDGATTFFITGIWRYHSAGKEPTINTALIFPEITTEKASEVFAWLDKMDEWKQIAVQNNLTTTRKEFTDNPWNKKMVFSTTETTEGISAHLGNSSWFQVTIGESTSNFDTIDIRTLLGRLSSCVGRAKEELRVALENRERDMQSRKRNQQSQEKAEELFK
jgi:hypothetical protein